MAIGTPGTFHFGVFQGISKGNAMPNRLKDLLSRLDPGYAAVGKPRTILGVPLRIDTIRGPWFSLGVHFDFQRPCVDIHFVWWIIIVGKNYEVEEVEEGCPLVFEDGRVDYRLLTTTSVDSPAMPAIEIEPRTYTLAEIKAKYFPNRDMESESAVNTSQPRSILDYLRD